MIPLPAIIKKHYRAIFFARERTRQMRRFHSCIPLETTRLSTMARAALFILTLSFLPPYTSFAWAGKVVFHDCDFLEFRGRDEAHGALFPISGEPVKGITQDISGTLFGGISSANFRFVTPSGRLIENLTLLLPPDAHPRETHYFGKVVPPDEPFQLAVSGLDNHGRAFDKTCKKLFTAQPVSIKIRIIPPQITTGTTTYFPVITNHGDPGSFNIVAFNKDGFVSRISPSSITLDTGESQKIELDISVPAGTGEGKNIFLRAQVNSTVDPGISNFAEMTVPVITPAEIVSP